MNLAAVWHAATTNALFALPLGAAALGLAFPQVGLPALRWLTLSEKGRSVAIALCVAWIVWWQWDARFSRGFTAGVASEQAKAQRALTRSAVDALDTYMANAARVAAIGEHLEKEKERAATRARTAVLADVAAGRVRLREPWRCVPDAAPAGGERDGCTERRAGAAAEVVGIGARADARLAACQATVRQYLAICGAHPAHGALTP